MENDTQNLSAELVKQKEIRKSISKESILHNWKTVSETKSDEIELIYYQKDVFNNESGIEQFLNSLNFSSIGI